MDDMALKNLNCRPGAASITASSQARSVNLIVEIMEHYVLKLTCPPISRKSSWWI